MVRIRYSSDDGSESPYHVAKEGFDETPASMYDNSGIPMTLALRVKVESISADDVILQIRAVPARAKVITTATGTNVTLLGGPIGGVSLKGVPPIHYKPGELLGVPIEGGGTLYLKGDVLDHQPMIAFGTPLVPKQNELSIRSPITGGDQPRPVWVRVDEHPDWGPNAAIPASAPVPCRNNTPAKKAASPHYNRLSKPDLELNAV